jgi:hypothetical protein
MISCSAKSKEDYLVGGEEEGDVLLLPDESLPVALGPQEQPVEVVGLLLYISINQ